MTASAPNPWDGVVVFVGGERWDGVRGSHRQLAEALSRRVPVLYVDNPVSPLTAGRSGSLERRPRPGVRHVGTDLAVLVPAVLPGLSRPGVRVTTMWLTRLAIRRALHELGRPRVRAVIVASLDHLLTSCPAECRLLYATDDYVAGASLMHIGVGYLERGERRQAACADDIVVVSDELAEHWRRLGHQPVVVPNGCDPGAYDGLETMAPSASVTLPGPIAGVVGRLSSLIDVRLLEAVAERGRSLLLVGPIDSSFEPERMARLVARANVQHVGPVPFEALPPFLAAIDVGLTPYADSAFNRASFPLKTLEYLAAGRAVVATDLPAHRSLDTDLLDLASGPEAFADAVDAALDRGADAAMVDRRRAVARRHSWDERADQVLVTIARSSSTEPVALPTSAASW